MNMARNMSRVGLVALSSVWLALAGCGNSAPPASPDNPPPLDDPAPKPKQDAVVAPSSELVKQGMDAIQKQDFAAAKQVLADAVAKDPKDPQAAFYYGVAMDGLGDIPGAMAQYKKALELDPKLVEAAVNLSGAQYEQKDAAGALATADQGLKANPKSPELLVNRALSLEALGKKDEAMSAYAAAVKARPDDPQLRITYAEYLAAGGKGDDALTELRAVQNVDDPTLLAALAVRFGRLKAFPDCVAALDKALKIKDSADLHTRRGVCRHGFNDDAGAQADYEAALKLDANFAPAYYYLGRHLEKKDKKKALEALEKAAKLDPSGSIGKQAKEAADDLKKKK
ncbi:MAG TPA: tetratricopeptide repeat protein [Polyangiaceae bacterium]|nr:tetratricopeptide repeat protein [Polyangiaceae bacterium]